MTSTIRRWTAAIIVAACTCITTLAGSDIARAQCTGATVTNNAGCNLQLCLYDLLGVSPVCWNIPTGGPTVIAFPAGFSPTGGFSAGGNTYPFSATGCTVCYTQRTTGVTRCCAVVCYDPVACTISIDPCTSAVCYK